MPQIQTSEEYNNLNPRQKMARILFDMEVRVASEELSDVELTGLFLQELGIEMSFIVDNHHLLQAISENKATLAEVQSICDQ